MTKWHRKRIVDAQRSQLRAKARVVLKKKSYPVRVFRRLADDVVERSQRSVAVRSAVRNSPKNRAAVKRSLKRSPPSRTSFSFVASDPVRIGDIVRDLNPVHELRKAVVCARRHMRREVLFALDLRRKGSGGSRKRKSLEVC